MFTKYNFSLFSSTSALTKVSPRTIPTLVAIFFYCFYKTYINKITCSSSQLTKLFLKSLGANEDDQIEMLIIEEFIQGVKSGNRTQEELDILANVTKRLEGFLKTNGTINLVEMATQKCSDLLVYTGEFV